MQGLTLSGELSQVTGKISANLRQQELAVKQCMHSVSNAMPTLEKTEVSVIGAQRLANKHRQKVHTHPR